MKRFRRPRRLRPGISFAVLAVLATASPTHARSISLVRDTTYRSVSEFGPDTLLVRELEFSNPLFSAVVDASSGVVIVAFHTSFPWTNRLLAYDYQARRVIWETAGELAPIDAQSNRALLGRENRTELFRVVDGKKLGGIKGRSFDWKDGVALRITGGRICRWDPVDGHDVWSADREIGGKADLVVRSDSVAYLVAEGIQRVDLRDGHGWSYSARVSRGDLYGTGDGGTEHVPSLYGGSRATNLTGAPLILGPDIFYAADTIVVRLGSRSGTVRWSQRLTRPRDFSLKQRALGLPATEEFLGRLVLRDAGSRVAVASLGWAEGPQSMLRADPPTLALLAKSDGHTLARVQVPGASFLNDLLCTPVGSYVCAYDRVMRMDDALKVRATFRAPIEFQPLGEFIDGRGAIVLTTGSGIVALSPDSLKLVWSVRCGRMLAIGAETGESKSRYVVTTQGLVRLDGGNELRPSAYYPLRGSWADLRDGWLLLGAATRLRIVTLVEREPPPRLD